MRNPRRKRRRGCRNRRLSSSVAGDEGLIRVGRDPRLFVGRCPGRRETGGNRPTGKGSEPLSWRLLDHESNSARVLAGRRHSDERQAPFATSRAGVGVAPEWVPMPNSELIAAAAGARGDALRREASGKTRHRSQVGSATCVTSTGTPWARCSVLGVLDRSPRLDPTPAWRLPKRLLKLASSRRAGGELTTGTTKYRVGNAAELERPRCKPLRPVRSDCRLWAGSV
jgi:hypothetical protein